MKNNTELEFKKKQEKIIKKINKTNKKQTNKKEIEDLTNKKEIEYLTNKKEIEDLTKQLCNKVGKSITSKIFTAIITYVSSFIRKKD